MTINGRTTAGVSTVLKRHRVVYPRIVSTGVNDFMCNVQRSGRVYVRATHRTRMKGS